jgi:hypothetical protein
MLSIKNVLMPFRLSLKSREPISLRVELTNKGSEPKLLSLALVVPTFLGIERTGIANKLEKRLGEIAPGKTNVYYYEIFPKTSTTIRDYPARLVIYEHYNTYEYISKEHKKDFLVKVTN